MSTKRALITGIFGQDAAYLAKYLLQQGYEVIGTHRRTSTLNTWRLRELGVEKDIRFEEFELLEQSNIIHTIRETRPTEIYNLAAQSFVGSSFVQPIFTSEANALGVTRILEAIRTVDPEIHFYQASTSEMFGKVMAIPDALIHSYYELASDVDEDELARIAERLKQPEVNPMEIKKQLAEGQYDVNRGMDTIVDSILEYLLGYSTQ